MADIRILKLKEDDDVLESVQEFCEKEGIKLGDFVSATGRMKDFEISAFSGQGGIENKSSTTPHEVVNVSGKVQKARGAFDISMKLSLARPGLSTMQGKLLKGRASGSLEIAIRNVNLGKIIEA
ncbi:MAG: PPC domain-containing DNA-binding protein [Candidatus Diapherotrites archaeon]